MSEIDPADLARLRSRRAWSEEVGEDRAARRAECAATRAGHLAVVVASGEVPRCEHCGETLSPDALRKAGYKPARS
ncbi:hypothetical protein [Actinomycetospora callitridis]|uniref:hypothetical protein n=1 Tax=Actinomycetospora callitridis TaxID=913944 RepID=UPI002366DA6E|nr:hypothetical protein [Actinomycetospora callitridis]MDD7921867.1 hypothetical protein [Actinomycetospora callitridis]